LNTPDDISPERRRLRSAYRAIAVLLGLLAGALLAVFWLSQGRRGPALPAFRGIGDSANLVARRYPQVDFSRIYPDMTPAEIDRLQRDCSAIHYAYEPFVQFLPRPKRSPFVNISEHGIRQGAQPAPWPPRADAVNIFVFGGSTTLGYHVRDDQTLPARLEERLRRRRQSTNIWCYNLGSGYHFSSQERARLAALLAENIRPHIALFIDGLNDFVQPDGIPQFTYDFYRFSAPDAPVPDRLLFRDHRQYTDARRREMIEAVLARYRRNQRLISAMAEAAGVEVLFVGQPVPWLDYDIDDPALYPFVDPDSDAQYRLIRLGYPRFAEAASEGAFGPRFLWLGDAFKDAAQPMYADRVHYSPKGIEVLAARLIEPVAGLIPKPAAAREGNIPVRTRPTP